MQGFATIPAELPFLPTLAEMLAQQDGAPYVLLPNRRSADQLKKLLPGHKAKIIPLSDLTHRIKHEWPQAAARLHLPPPINPLQRTRILWQLLLQRRDVALSPTIAWQLAQALGELLDECAMYEVAGDAWAALAPADFAAHWGVTLEFLQIILTHWPAILAERGQSDPAAYQHAAFLALCADWAENPLHQPVIAAGSTGSQPATAKLLCTIAKMPRGLVVLPGLDLALAATDVPPHHPQAGMHFLLQECRVPPHQVQRLGALGTGALPARAALWSQVLQNDAAITPLNPDALAHWHYVPCQDSWAEVQTIALTVKQALDAGAQQIAVITPAARLAANIHHALQLHGIHASASQGARLNDFPAIRFMLLSLALAAAPHDPHTLLVWLQHPAAGFAAEQLSEWQDTLRAQPFTHFSHFAWQHQISVLQPIAEAFEAWQQEPPRAVSEWLSDIQTILITHCPNWLLQNGYEHWENLMQAWDERIAPMLNFHDFAVWWQRLVVQTRTDAAHNDAMVQIWGLLEARLQHADVAILAGLNEGVWPAEPAPNPFLSRSMRAQLGLPPPEKQIGQMAHDFVQGLHSAPLVYLTRAMVEDGNVQTPARWLQQLDVYLQRRGSGLAGINAQVQWQQILANIYSPAQEIAAVRPAPSPPLPARPRSISASGIQQLRQNPYALYAQRILNLQIRKPLRREPMASEVGDLVHAALAEFFPRAERFKDDAPAQMLLLAMQRYPRAFWQGAEGVQLIPRLQGLLQHALILEQQARAAGQRIMAVEAQGRGHIRAGNRTITVHARADRIDRAADGTLSIIDYKTGTAPSQVEIERGYHVQLPLAAWLIEQGGFQNIPNVPVSAVSFWRLHATRHDEDIKSWGADKLEKWLAQLEEGLAKTLTYYLAETNAFTASAREQNYDDYAVLARKGLW